MSTPHLTVFLFGESRFIVNGERVTNFHSSKVAALGAYLAATGRAHTRETLAGLLWPDYDSAQAKKNLRGAIYHLRNHLDDFLTVTRQEVGIVNDGSVEVDCRRFEQLMELAAVEPDTDTVTSILEDAVLHYGGDFLDGFSVDEADLFEAWQRNERERYRQMVMQAYSSLVRQAIDAVDALSGIRHSTQLLALDPLSEDGHRGLMLLLAMDGRPSAALAQYEQCRLLLWEELGVEPDEETIALADRIREGELSGLRYAAPLPARRSLHNLPAELTTFFGREQEVEQVKHAVTDAERRLTTIVGPGGVGKSRLAIEVGSSLIQAMEKQESSGSGASTEITRDSTLDACSDGIYFVRLAALEADGDVDVRICTAILEAMQIEVAGSEDLVAKLGQVLADTRLLLILDNFEQLQQQADVLTRLLRSAPGLRLLVTSRLRLNVRGEQVVLLEGLPLPPAGQPAQVLAASAPVQLFLRVATSVSPGFTADERALAAIGETCRLVQGLPLGIELAAAWVPLLSCQEIAEQIEQNLDFLSNNMPDLPERHRSLRAVFDQSWRLLTPDEAQAMRRLAIFRGGFTREAASTVANIALPTLLALLEKSLLRRAKIDNDVADGLSPRFELPEMVRQYAGEQLAASDETATCMAAYLGFYSDWMDGLAGEFRSGDQAAALDTMAAEIENVRSAFSWAVEIFPSQPVVATPLLQASVDALFDFLDIRGWFQEGQSLFAAASDIVEPADRRLCNQLRARQAWFLFHVGEQEKSRSRFMDCLDSMKESEDRINSENERLFVLNYLSAVEHHMGDDHSARIHLAQAETIEGAHANVYAAGVTANIAAMIAFASRDLDEARRRCEQALHFKRLGNERRGRTYTLNILGRVDRLQGELDDARRAFAESLDIAEELADPRAIATAQAHLGSVALASGQLSGARRQYQIALDGFRHIGSLMEISASLAQLGQIDVEEEQYAKAAAHLQEALQIALDLHSTSALATALIGVAHLWAAAGAVEQAAAILSKLDAQARLDLVQHDGVDALRQRIEQTVTTDTGEAASDLASTAQSSLMRLSAFLA